MACVNTPWIDKFDNHSMSYLASTQSDHKPILVQTKG